MNMAVQTQLIALAALIAESEALLGVAGKNFFLYKLCKNSFLAPVNFSQGVHPKYEFLEPCSLLSHPF